MVTKIPADAYAADINYDASC